MPVGFLYLKHRHLYVKYSTISHNYFLISTVNWIFYILIATLIVYLLVIGIYYFAQERLLFVAKPIAKKHRFQISEEYDEYFIESVEGGEINALHIKSEDPRGLIIYFHGNTGNLKRWSLTASDLTSHGYDVLMFDYRGFGKSKGKRCEKNMHIDAKCVYELACTLFDEDEIILYGRSMGTGMSIKLATEIKASKLFLETPYYSMLEVAKHHAPFIPMKWLLRFEFNSYQWIKKVKCPVFIFHGTKDKVIPYSHSLRLFELIKHNTDNKMVTIPRGRHSNLNSFPLFRDKMKDFFKKSTIPVKESTWRD